MKYRICYFRQFVSAIPIQKLCKAAIISGFLTAVLLPQLYSSDDNTSQPVLPPVALCRNITVQLGPTGTVSITGSDINSGSYDPDGTITNLSVVPNNFTCAQKGSNSVVLTVTDNEGLTSTCNATVIVEDRIPPVMVCRNAIVTLDASGRGSLVVADINNGSSDNCPGGLSFFISRTSFTCTDVGAPVPVTLTGTDASGNSASCISQVTVLDNIPPVINTKPFTLVLGSSGTGTLLPSDIDNGSFDNCGPVTLSVLPNTFNCSNLGQNTVTVTAIDTHGNSTTKTSPITVSTDLDIQNMTLSSCDLIQSLAIFTATPSGGDGIYSYFWRGLNPAVNPFMIIVPFPPSLILSNTSTLASPFYNNSIPNGYHDIRLVITDGKGCKDSSDIKIRNTGAVFNNRTIKSSQACEGEIKEYSVNEKSDATYSWSVNNGTILTADTDTSSISVRWDLGVIQGRVTATIEEPNSLFPANRCQSSVVDSVSLTPVPVPAFNNPVTNVCSNSVVTYTLTNTYAYQGWIVAGGAITAGGSTSDNFVTVRWGSGPSGSVSAAAGSNALCTGTVVLNINIFNVSGAVTSLTDISCNGGSDGSVTVAASPGSGFPPYSYSLDGGAFQMPGTFNNLTLGNHIVTIRDGLMCTFTVPFLINQPQPLVSSVSSLTNVSCFGGSDGSVTITASGGTQPYQYRLNVGPLQPSNIFSGLIAGSYIITVQDSHNCTKSVPVTINQPAAPLNATAVVTNVACFGASTGRIDITVTGGTQPYTFLWNSGAVTEDLINIAAGNYSVVITDSKGCTFNLASAVTQPAAPLSGTTSVTNVLCFGGTTGAVDLTVAGGTPPYSFVWSNGAITEDILNLTAGLYSVIITDANGCTASVNVNVTQPLAPLVGSVVSQINVSCFGGNNGSITVAGSGGTAPYNYQLGSGSFQPSGTFGSLTAGLYNITVRDANLCTFILPVTITGPAAPLSGVIFSQTNVLCFGNATGSVTITGSGGTPAYQYNIDGGPFQATSTFGTLTAGLHTVIIRDNNLCTFSLPVTITEPASAVSGSIVSQTDAGCFGASTGSVTVSGSGGVPPYTYSIDAGAFQPSGVFSNLVAGAHTVIVRDNNNCTFTVPVTIMQPAAPLAVTITHTDVLCLGGTTGTAEANVTGGTPPYTYLWNNVPPATTSSISGLPAGNYSVTVTDNNGCTAAANVAVTEPSAAMSATLALTGVTCNGGSDGTIDLTVSDGTLPLVFLWSNGAVTEDINGLIAGTYTVSVTDANGCTANASGTITEPAPLTGSIAATDVACFGGNTGSLNLTVNGGTAPYSFIWSNGAVTEDINNLIAGNYTVTVTDDNGCALILNSTIVEPASALSGTITSQTDVSVYGGNDGSVTVSGSGGTAPYMFSLDGGSYQVSGTFGSLQAGSYTVTIRDAALCTFDVPVTISQPFLALSADIVSQANVSCFGGNNGSVTVTGIGGNPPYNYSFDGGVFQPSGTFSSLAASSYIITVSDATPSVYTLDVTITEPEELTVAVSGEDVHCFGASTGSVTATPSGGTAPYSFSWNTVPEQTTPTATGLPAGIYTVIVTDANNCTATNSVTITEPAVDMVISISQTDVLCNGAATGSASVSVTGGLEPYTYLWNTDPVQTKETITDIPAGSYDVVVTDSYGCVKAGSVNILEPEALIAESSAVDASCPDTDDGSINLTISGGVEPYSVIWSDGETTEDRTRVTPGTYTAVISDANDCAASVSVEVGFTGSFGCVTIQQVITPNGDGFNDEWQIKNIGMYPNAEVKIFNRWGELVFSTKNLAANPWDGRKDGKLVPTDSYHYILYLNDGSAPKSGVISVIR